MKNSNIPKFRFNNFSTNWTKYALRDFILYKNGKGNEANQSENGKYELVNLNSISINGGLKPSKKFINDAKETLEQNDLVMILSDVGHGDLLGRVAIIPVNNYYVLNQRVALIRPNNKEQTSYLFVHINRHQNYFKSQGAGMSQLNISKSSVENFTSYYPNESEQQSIGSLFKTLDDLLLSYKENLAHYQSLKATMLSKMFPKAGQKEPEIRLDGFEGEWFQTKIGNLSEIVRGASPRPIQDSKWFDKESNIGWLRISDVTEQNGRIKFLEQRLSQAGQEKTRVLKTPHLLLSIAATVGKPLINYVQTGVHDGFLIFLNPEFDKEFMFQWLDFFRPNWNKYGQPGSQVNLNSEIVRNQEIQIPFLDEQVAIGKFFSDLDETISTYQEKISTLEDLKKKLLKEMFI